MDEVPETALLPPGPPLTTPAEPSRPGRRPAARFVLAAISGLLTMALVAGAGFAYSSRARIDAWISRAATASDTPAAVRTPAVDAADRARASGVQLMLDQRASALTGADPVMWMAAVDLTAPAFRTVQRALYDRIRVLPLDRWHYDVLGGTEAASTTAAAGSHPWVAIVRLTYRLTATTPEVTRMQHLTVVERPAGWKLVSDTDGRTDRDLWDLTSISVAQGKRSLVIGAGTQRKKLAGYARAADAAAVTVDAALGKAWPRTVVVIAPADAEQMAAMLGWSDASRLDQIAAVTAGVAHGGGESDRILLNPTAFAAFGSLGRHVVLTHETVHVAARALQQVTPPLWLEEGYADFVAYRDSGLTRRSIAEEALDAVDDGHLPDDLPTEAAFDPVKGDIGAAYGQAWLAMDLMSRDHGPSKVTRFYEIAAGFRAVSGSAGSPLASKGPSPNGTVANGTTKGSTAATNTAPKDTDQVRAADLAAAFEDVVGSDQAAFTADWRAYLKSLSRAG